MRRKNKSRNTDLISRLRGIISKYTMSATDKQEVDGILSKLEGKTSNKIQSTKLNNNEQNNIAKAIYEGDSNLDNLTVGHLTSTTGSYRRGRIDLKKE